MNFATVIVLLIVLAMVIVAIHFLQKGKDSACCGNKKSSCSGCSVDCPFRR